ncbi:MAG: hypothetical protein WA322_05560 [Pseudolabrys sp.]
MISEIVLFRLPEGMSRRDAMAKYRLRVPMWQANPDLIHKAFLFDEASRRGGGVYLWKNIEAAKKAHGPAFQEGIQSIFGAKPEFQYFEAPIVIDNSAKEVIDNAA